MYDLKISVDGEEVELTEFPSKIITNAIVAMLMSLRDVEEVKEAVVEISKIE